MDATTSEAALKQSSNVPGKGEEEDCFGIGDAWKLLKPWAVKVKEEMNSPTEPPSPTSPAMENVVEEVEKAPDVLEMTVKAKVEKFMKTGFVAVDATPTDEEYLGCKL